MENYKIGLVPGPVKIPQSVRNAYLREFGSADIEEDFFKLYEKNEAALQKILGTKNKIAIMSGEAMSILWGGLKSVSRPGTKLLCVANGLFSLGFGEMGEQIGLEVKILDFGLNGVPHTEQVRTAAHEFRPDIITAVHCETPSGTLAPLDEIGKISKEVGAILIVDFVASGIGTPVNVDENNIDIGLLGSQKVLSMPPHLSMATVSDRAWEKIEAVNYVGYDALLPWRDGVKNRSLPYTHDWNALAALEAALKIFTDEGMENVYARHQRVAKICRDGVKKLGLELFPAREEICSPTVTAVKVPEKIKWDALNSALRERGVALGGNYGPLAGRVFRFGHMGSQADESLIRGALDAVEEYFSRI